MAALTFTPIAGMPMVRAGDDLPTLILAALAAQKLQLEAGDMLVIAQKIVSKSEGRQIRARDDHAVAAKRSHSRRKPKRTRASSN